MYSMRRKDYINAPYDQMYDQMYDKLYDQMYDQISSYDFELDNE